MEAQERPITPSSLPVIIRKETETTPPVDRPADVPPANCGPLWDQFMELDPSERPQWLADHGDAFWEDKRVWPCLLQGHQLASSDFWRWIVMRDSTSEKAVFFIVDRKSIENVVEENARYRYRYYLRVAYDEGLDTIVFEVVSSSVRTRAKYSFLLLTAILVTYPDADEFWFVPSSDRQNVLFKVREKGVFHYFDLSDFPAEITDF